MNKQDDIQIAPVNMAQTMYVMACAVGNMIGSFAKPEDSDQEKATSSLVCLAIFLQQLVAPAKHKQEVAAILKIVRDELLEEPK